MATIVGGAIAHHSPSGLPYKGHGSKYANAGSLTREAFVHAVRDAVLATATLTPEQRSAIAGAKLVYGAGTGAYRGICYYGAWKGGETSQAFVEIAATGEENATQLAGTTVHELGHVIAGHGAGHGADWKAACALLGLKDAKASGHVYTESGFSDALGVKVILLGQPTDGMPTFGMVSGAVAPKGTLKPCPMGRGVRGGKSHGKGSGSRLRLWECGCATPVKVRVASDDFKATCQVCSTSFEYRGK